MLGCNAQLTLDDKLQGKVFITCKYALCRKTGRDWWGPWIFWCQSWVQRETHQCRVGNFPSSFHGKDIPPTGKWKIMDSKVPSILGYVSFQEVFFLSVPSVFSTFSTCQPPPNREQQWFCCLFYAIKVGTWWNQRVADQLIMMSCVYMCVCCMLVYKWYRLWTFFNAQEGILVYFADDIESCEEAVDHKLDQIGMAPYHVSQLVQPLCLGSRCLA